MTQADEYMRKAAELERLARETNDPLLKLSYADQAQSYRMLAADRRLRVEGLR